MTRDRVAARVDALFSERALAHPHLPAVVDGAETVSYGRLLEAGRQQARRLASAGVRPGSLVGLRMSRGWRAVAAMLGVWRHGCGYVPVDPEHPAARQEMVIADVGLTHLLEQDGSLTTVRTDVPAPRHPPDTAYVLFTSGSTGRPKGVVVRHANLLSLFDSTSGVFDFGRGDVWSQFHSYNFDFSVWEIWGPLLTGGTCVPVPQETAVDASRLAAFLVAHRVTVLDLVPSVFRRLTEAARTDGVRLPALRNVVLGGEAVTADTLRCWAESGIAPEARLYNMYGITEITVHATVKLLDAAAHESAGSAVSIGRPLPGTRIVLAEDGHAVPDGTPGEIHVSGGGVAWGYLGRDDLTRERFVEADLDGTPRTWYRSGDYAVQRHDGDLVYVGRRDEQVKISGVRVELGEIEHALARHAAVGQAVVLPVDTRGPRGVELVAAVTPDRSAEARPTDTELRTWAGELLPQALVPRGFRWLDAVPLTPNGKVDRRALLAETGAWWRDAAARIPEAPDGDALERLWRAALPGGAASGGFLSLGGDSLLAARLLTDVRRELGAEVPLALLLRDNASLAQLRAAVAAAGRKPDDAAGAAASGATSARGARDIPDISPLSPEQRRLWLMDRLHPEAVGYNVVGALRVRGRLREDALRAALRTVVCRHDALRARLTEDADGEPLWHYASAAEPDLETAVHVGPLEDESVLAFVRERAARTVPLDQPPLLRAAALASGTTGETCLVVCLHHIVSDQLSLDLVLTDLARAYTAEVAGQDTVLGAAPSFAEYARRAAAEAGGPRWTADLAYWRDLLADAPAEVRLPFRTAPAQLPSLRGTSHATTLGTGLTRRLDALLREQAATPAMLFVAAVGVVLSAWAAQRTVVVGMPAVRRRTTAEDDLVGFLLSTLPVRLDVGPDDAFTDLLAHVRDRCVDALEHDAPSFDAVVDALGLPSVPGQNPVFNVWFNDVSRGGGDLRFGDGVAHRMALPALSALFELNFYLHRDASGYRLELVNATDRVPDGVAREILDQCLLVLRQAADRPDTAVAAFSLVTEAARHAGAVLDAPVPSVPPRGADAGRAENPTARFAEVARQRPGETALTAPGSVLSYGDLVHRVDELAASLTAAGVGPGAVVEIHAKRGVHLPVALLAVWRAGGVAALMDAGLPAVRFAELGERVGAGWRVSLPEDPMARCEVTRPRTNGRTLPGASHVLFTSGSGGEPVGVVVPHDVLTATLDAFAEAFPTGPSDRVPLFSGLGHDPLLRDILVPLLGGGRLVVPPAGLFTDPSGLAAFLREHSVSVLHTTPALLELLVSAAEDTGLRWDALRLAVLGGGPSTAGLVRRLCALAPATVVNAYGTTETPQIATWRKVVPDDFQESRAQLPVAVTGTAVLVVVTPDGAPAGIGQRGEVLVRSRCLATGYLKGSGHDNAFVPDPGRAEGVRAFRTGDLGRLDPSGGVHLDGRLDRQVQFNGFRVELAEIEAAALRCHGVTQAAAALVDTLVGDALALHVVTANGVLVEPDALRRQLRRFLPAYALPSHVRVVPALGTNANHKVVLDTAHGTAGTGPAPAAHGHEPRQQTAAGHRAASEDGETLNGILRVLGALLERDVRADENFFDAGLNSISLLRLRTALSRTLGLPLQVSDLFAYPNARALAAHLDGAARIAPAVPRAPAPGTESLREVRRAARMRIRRER